MIAGKTNEVAAGAPTVLLHEVGHEVDRDGRHHQERHTVADGDEPERPVAHRLADREAGLAGVRRARRGRAVFIL